VRLRETCSLRHADAIRELFALDAERGEVVELRTAAPHEEPAAGSPSLARHGAG
jgi:hypothetical protein